MKKEYVQVLWVEDDAAIIQSYPIEAAKYGLQLVPFKCWKDAEKALIDDFKRWSAIILDAKCKYKISDQDNATRFLSNVLAAINKICAEHKRVIPWYVLSGGSEEELNDLIIDDREQWDGDWKERKFYRKTTDREILFHRIPYHASISPEMQIRLVFYRDVFDAIRKAGVDGDVECYLEDLLLPIHSYSESGKEYNNKMTLIRKCVEHIFQSMAENGILPNKKLDNKYVLHDLLVDRRGGINNTWCSCLLAGKEIKRNENVIARSIRILPNVLKDSFQQLIEISSAYEHAVNKNANNEQQENSRQTPIFLEYIDHAPYLLRGMVMELCNIILWYSRYLEDHDNIENNVLNWQIL